LPTDFQGLSFTSPPAAASAATLPRQTFKNKNARVSELAQAFS
jgi:hypothetical protein